MKTADWFVADDFAAEGGWYVHFLNARMYLLSLTISYGKQPTLHFMNGTSRGPPYLVM